MRPHPNLLCIFVHVCQMWGESHIHLLHKITESPSKMRPLRKSTPCQLQRGTLCTFTIYKQMNCIHNISNQKHQQLPPSNSTTNHQHNHQQPTTERPTKPRYSYANVTEGYQSFKPNPTPIYKQQLNLTS